MNGSKNTTRYLPPGWEKTLDGDEFYEYNIGMKKQEVNISRETFLTIMRLMELSARASNFVLNRIFETCDVGTHEEFQGVNFSHERNLERLKDSTKDLSVVSRILSHVTMSEDGTFQYKMDEISRDEDFKRMLERYSVRVSEEGGLK